MDSGPSPPEEDAEERRDSGNKRADVRIERLPQAVINRIAAGEVVVRPSAALKELLENSIDAGSRSIHVTVRGGGLKLLQITDDGSGIRQADLPLLCERFTTSKLRRYEDLSSGAVTTFGFRGEALASIAAISRLSVTTLRRDDDDDNDEEENVDNNQDRSGLAYRATYDALGKMAGRPVPCARNGHGTTLAVADLFYNLPSRRCALKGAADEYRMIMDVVMKYSIRYADVAFCCYKHNSAAVDFRSVAGTGRVQSIRNAYGSILSSHLLCFDVRGDHFAAECAITAASFSMRRGIYIFFINGRLVDCNVLKKAVAALYATSFLAKNKHPFVYIDLTLPPADVDVNVHPNKKEVRFLREDAVIEAVVTEFANRLKTTETSRSFLTQSIIVPKNDASIGEQLSMTPNVPGSTRKKLTFAVDAVPSQAVSSQKAANSNSNTRGNASHVDSEIQDNLSGDHDEGSELNVGEKRQSQPQRQGKGDGEIERNDDDDDDDDSEKRITNRTSKGVSDEEILRVTTPLSKARPPKSSQRNHSDEFADEIGSQEQEEQEASDDDVEEEEDDDFENQPEIKKLKAISSRSKSTASQSRIGATPIVKAKYAKDKVRTGSNNPVGLLDRYITITPKKRGIPTASNGVDTTSSSGTPTHKPMAVRRRRKERTANAPPMLTSVETLLESCKTRCHRDMAAMLRSHIFVGVVSRDYVLVQHETQLLLVHVTPLLAQLGYENILYRFSDHDSLAVIELEPPVPCRLLLERHVRSLQRNSNGTDVEVIDSASCNRLLCEKSAMLTEYFGIVFETRDQDNGIIDDDDTVLFVKGIPGILNDHGSVNANEGAVMVSASMSKLGEVLYDIAVLTDWGEEMKCFDHVAKIMANWYAKHWQPVVTSTPSTETTADKQRKTADSVRVSPVRKGKSSGSTGKKEGETEKEEEEERRAREWVLRHTLLEAMKQDFFPPKRLQSQNVIREITSTSKLYRIFERC